VWWRQIWSWEISRCTMLLRTGSSTHKRTLQRRTSSSEGSKAPLSLKTRWKSTLTTLYFLLQIELFLEYIVKSFTKKAFSIEDKSQTTSFNFSWLHTSDPDPDGNASHHISFVGSGTSYKMNENSILLILVVSMAHIYVSDHKNRKSLRRDRST